MLTIYLGSAGAVAAAQRTISTALVELSKSIDKAESLKSSAINEFAGHTEQLLKIMGPETAKYSEKKSEIENLIRMEYEKLQKLQEEVAHKQGNYNWPVRNMEVYHSCLFVPLGEVQRYSHLIHVTENRLNGSNAALAETQRRTQDLNKLNDQVEKTIQNIPAMLQKVKTQTETRRSWLLPWHKRTSTHTSTKMV